jgi:2-amino-4-hydroxy-6-hydroxymethyldihydropteridine diphosphokinase
MGDVDAYVAVGSNIEPELHILLALDALRRDVTVRNASAFYRTAPVGRPDQDDYLNGVFSVSTSLSPRELKHGVLRRIEHQLGRVRGEDPNAARTIDLDLIVYGDLHEEAGDLRLPDPDIRTRAFVAVPLLELAPGLRLPDTGEALVEVVAGMHETLRPDAALTEQIQARLRHE